VIGADDFDCRAVVVGNQFLQYHQAHLGSQIGGQLASPGGANPVQRRSRKFIRMDENWVEFGKGIGGKMGFRDSSFMMKQPAVNSERPKSGNSISKPWSQRPSQQRTPN